MFLNISLDKAFAIVGQNQLVKEEVIIPGQFPPASHSPYRPDYDWLFIYERRLGHFLESWLKEFRHELIGAKGILSEALSNAYYHGHGKDPMLPIEIRVYWGVHGLIVRIKDFGNGFSINQIHQQYLNGKAYFHLAGNGMRAMVSSNNFGIFYSDAGSAFHLLYLFNKSLLDLGENMISKNPTNNSAERCSRSDEDKVSAAAKIKSNACFVRPPEGNNWIVFAILLGLKKRNIAAFGIDRDKINPLVQSCGLLINSIDKLNDHLQVGKGLNISVRSPRGILSILRNRSKEHILISLIKEDANPVLAANKLPETFNYLHERLV